MMSKHINYEFEFLRELISDFISSPELYEMSAETPAGTISLRKYDNLNKIGFKPNGGKHD